MSRPSSSVFSDTSLLDLENVTFEEWRTLLYNRIVQQKNIFIIDFKKKVISDINVCMKNVKSDTTVESIQKRLTNKINENQFEIEYQKFVDGIVGSTFEYFCQLIIKNSMENIKRTQSALNSFSLTTNTNAGMIKLCCNEDIKLPELPNLNQIQCLPELNNNNNNTINSDLVIQSHLFNNSSQNDSNPLKAIFEEKQNDINAIVNQIDTNPLNNHSQKKTGLLAMELNASNEINEENYVQTANSSVIIDDEDDLKTTQALMSLAMKITNQQEINFKYADGFEDENINDLNILSTCNEIEISSHLTEQNSDQIGISLVQQNGNQITYPPILEDEYQITNSLKILESLVNIEHSKLEKQTSVTEEELPPTNIKSKEKKYRKKSNNFYFRKKRNNKSKTRELRGIGDEEWNQKGEKHKKDESKEIKEKKRKLNQNQRPKGENNLNNSFNGNSSSSSVVNQNEQNVPVKINGLSLSESHKKITPTSAKSINTVSSLEISLKSQSAKDNLPANELKTHSSNVENVIIDEERKTTTSSDSNALKSSPIVSTISYETNKSALVMKISDYKKLYEIDRKSLFSPDVIITSKLANDSINKTKGNGFITVQSNHLLNGTQETKFQVGDSISIKKKRLKHCSKNINGNQLHIKKTNSNLSINGFKRLKVSNLDNEINVNNTNDKRSLITDVVENQGSNNVDALKELNETNTVLEGKELITNTVNDFSILPEWLKRKWVEYNIKPSYVVIDRNMRKYE